MKKFLQSALIAVLLTAGFMSSVTPAFAQTADSGLPMRTSQEVVDMWNRLMQPQNDKDNPYITIPSVTLPYKTGAINESYIQKGVDAANFYRFITGLPGDLEQDKQLNVQAQYGSLLLAASEDFSHTPHQPGDMSEALFNLGSESTSSSNIYADTGYPGNTLVNSVDGYMDDSDVSNLHSLGHRRWILNPALQKVGFGLAENNDWRYSAMQIFDESRSARVPYHYVAYPAAGLFPSEVFPGHSAWSVSLNPEEYDWPELSEIKVDITNVATKKIWVLDQNNETISEKDDYFNVETSGYGEGYAVIFRPGDVDAYSPGDKYDIRITGLKDLSGNSADISYRTEFMSVKKAAQPAPTPTPAPTPGDKLVLTDMIGHWARQTVEWGVKTGIVTGYKDGSFHPDNNVNEAEFLVMMMRALGETSIQPSLSSKEHWAEPFYDRAIQLGIPLPGEFNADKREKPLNRFDIAVLFAYMDTAEIMSNDDAAHYVLENHLAAGKKTGDTSLENYHGSDLVTRAEAVQFLKNAVGAGWGK